MTTHDRRRTPAGPGDAATRPSSRTEMATRSETLQHLGARAAAGVEAIHRLLLGAITRWSDGPFLPIAGAAEPPVTVGLPALPQVSRSRLVSVAAAALLPLSLVAPPGAPTTGPAGTPVSGVRGAAGGTSGQTAPAQRAWGPWRGGGGDATLLARRSATSPPLELDEPVGVVPPSTLPPAEEELPEPTPRDEPVAEEGFPEELVPRVTALSDVMGVEYGETVGEQDVREMAEVYGREIGEEVRPIDVRWLEAHHRAKQARLLEELGIDYGDGVGEDDIARAAGEVGVDIEEPVTARDVERVRRVVDAVLEGSRPAPVFARVDDVELRVPSKDSRLVGFHEAAVRGALRLGPQQNVPMRTLGTRNRATPKRSAADIAVEPATPVLSPVTGTVVSVQRYALYGKYPDTRIEIVPASDRSKTVVVLHVSGPIARVGDRVEGGNTVIAERGREFPFASQIDRFVGWGPHVHVEVKPR